MNKRTVKIVAIVIACLFLLGIVGPLLGGLVFSAPTDDPTLAEYTEKENSALEEMAQLEQEMNAAGEAAWQLEQALSATNAELQEAQGKLAEAEAQEKTQMEAFKGRFAAMAEYDAGSWIGMLLAADSFSDFIDRLVIAREIAEYDKNVRDGLRQAKEEIQTETARVETVQQTQSQNKADLDAAMDDLYRRSQAAAQYMAELEADKEAYLQYLAAKEEEERQARLLAGIQEGNGDADLGKVPIGSLLWPTDTQTITSPFSPNRVNPVSGVLRPHTGTDIGAQQGAPIWAAQGGTVTLAEANGGYGNCVILDHGNGVSTLYGHMSAILVQKGEYVSAGTQIGRVGSTGNSTGPHLHFEVIIDGTAVDAMQFFI